MQELFPESYAETAAWLRREVNANGDSLAHCEQQLQAAVEQDSEFQVLAAGCQVSMSPRLQPTAEQGGHSSCNVVPKMQVPGVLCMRVLLTGYT